MIDARYTELKRMLEVRRLELRRSLGAKLRDVRTNNGQDGALVGALDAAEASDTDLQQDIAIALAEMTAEVLERVEHALTRLSSGVYGSCTECSGEISLERLAALPFALRCRECEETREIREKRSRQLAMARNTSFLPFAAASRD
jgi:RNA polymerase-binding transcription factor